MPQVVAKLLFSGIAVLPILRAGTRVWWFERTYSLPQAVERLRQVPEFRCGRLANPRWLDGCVSRLLPVVPPLGYGACVKRSLILLDLWSRCGLEPSLHLGYRRLGNDQSFHAWVTAGDYVSPLAGDHIELWSG